ncbi:MAG: hypothetical protein FWE02_04970 [Defluviitaleaceae bacterium]|nr:hypothetical protein [Defluviitaleaceae bacterium]
MSACVSGRRIETEQESLLSQLHQHLVETYGENHDLYVESYEFIDRDFYNDVWSIGEYASIFTMKSESRSDIEFQIVVSSRYSITDRFRERFNYDVSIYITNFFEEHNINGADFSGMYLFFLHSEEEIREHIYLDTVFSYNLPFKVRITVNNVIWQEDIYSLVEDIKEWERIGNLSRLNIYEYLITIVYDNYDNYDIRMTEHISLTPTQIQSEEFIEILIKQLQNLN